MMRTLYITSTANLSDHAKVVKQKAENLGWTVIPGAELSSSARVQAAGEADALLLLLGWSYESDLEGTGLTEQEWDSAIRSGKPARAVCADPHALWRLSDTDAFSNPDRHSHLRAFWRKIENSVSGKRFTSDPSSALQPAEEVLEVLSACRSKKTFIVWDFSPDGPRAILEALAEDPVYGFPVEIPGLREREMGGTILHDIVVRGISGADRVLVFVDSPNANVAFEAGLALALGKEVLLVHYGPHVPGWLNESVLRGYVVMRAQTPDELRTLLRSDRWKREEEAAPVPSYGGTLFLCPSVYAGAGWLEAQRRFDPDWTRVTPNLTVSQLHAEYSVISQVVWCISAFPPGAFEQDGAQTAANGIIAGWFYARALKDPVTGGRRIAVLRERYARAIVDVLPVTTPFEDRASFLRSLREIPSFALPEPVSPNIQRFQVPADLTFIGYEMVQVPGMSTGQRAWIGVAPVTVGEYRCFCTATGRNIPSWLQGTGSDDNAPMVNVSAIEAQEFCRWLGPDFTLPSESFWWHCVLAGSKKRYWWGDDGSVVRKVAWSDNAASGPQAVKQKKPNTWGLYDVLGNVWEWTDPIESSIETPYSISGPQPIAVAKIAGGAYDTSSNNLLDRGVERDPSSRAFNIGFRCMRR